MNIISIIDTIGSAGEAAKLSGIPRQTIETWIKQAKFPRWREADVKKLQEIAKQRAKLSKAPT